MELHNGIDTGNFWFPSPLKNGVVVWENMNATSNIGLYATGIPLKNQPVKELCFRSRGTVWMIVAASIAKTEMKPELAGPIEIRANAVWGAIEQDNDVIPGSIADFSNLLDAPTFRIFLMHRRENTVSAVSTAIISNSRTGRESRCGSGEPT